MQQKNPKNPTKPQPPGCYKKQNKRHMPVGVTNQNAVTIF